MTELQRIWLELDVQKPKGVRDAERGATFVRFQLNGKTYECSVTEIVKGETKRVRWDDDDL